MFIEIYVKFCIIIVINSVLVECLEKQIVWSLLHLALSDNKLHGISNTHIFTYLYQYSM